MVNKGVASERLRSLGRDGLDVNGLSCLYVGFMNAVP